MQEKFKNYRDEDLVELVKKGDSAAELELFYRYQPSALIVGRKLYAQFRKALNCDVEDLENSAMLAVFIAAKSYKGNGKFVSYWSVVARNQVMDTIKSNSDMYLSNNSFSFISFDDNSEEISLFRDSGSKDNDYLYNELISILDNPELAIDELSKKMFIMYLDGYSSSEIAAKLNLKDHKVRYQLKKVREKLEQFLLPSF